MQQWYRQLGMRGARALWKPCLLALLATVALATCALPSSASAKGAASASPAASGPTLPHAKRYAKVRRICPAPRRGDASCFALALVPAAAGTPAAQAYETAAGATSKGPAGGLTPSDLASAYGYSPSASGSGQTVGIVDAYDDPKIEADLGKFDAQYGLPACTSANGCFTKVGQTGSTTKLPKADERGWSVEMALDVETVHSACPNCKIVLVEADTEGLADLAASVNEAVSLGATEVSNSYGELESAMGPTEQAAYNHPGVVITASAGDSGYHDWDDVFEAGGAPAEDDAPASLPTVVSVGGTALKLSSRGTRKSETVWNDSGLPSGKGFKQFSATGGGCSTLFTAPAWQQSVAGWASTGCGSKRLDNDIAAVADPYTGFDIYTSYKYEPSATTGWETIGGTSLSSPLVASLYALAGGSHGVGYPASTLYSSFGDSSALYDVTQGGDGYCDGEAPGPCGEPAVNEEFGELDCEGTLACDAAAGFDGPAGVGAPNGLGAFGGVNVSAPTVLTEAASDLETSSAVLNATVDPNGASTSCTFEYGPTTAYGKSAPCASAPGSGSSPVAVSATITGLSPKTAYRFRITATNSAGTSTGKPKKLKTP